MPPPKDLLVLASYTGSQVRTLSMGTFKLHLVNFLGGKAGMFGGDIPPQ